MTTETTTTEQSNEESVLVRPIAAGIHWERLESVKIVHVDWRLGGSAMIAVMRAMRDPANVMEVSAYAKVVEALERAGNYFGEPSEQSPQCAEEERANDIAAALSLVHPAEAET